MFETQKIDSFFSGEKNLLDEEEKIFISRRTRVVRFFKLFLPCLTALLLGVGVVLFDFETTNDTALTLADDEKIYFEKFRMKNTVFEITEKDNQFSTLKADIVEEIEPGKKMYNLVNPYAKTLDKGREITLIAKSGKYNQDQQALDLKTNVISNYNHQMEMKTNSVSYNFATEYGYGNERITGNGEKGYFEADKFTFSKPKGIITLINNVYMKSGDMTLRTPDKTVMYMNENKFITSNATVTKGQDALKGDVITAFFEDTKHFQINRAFSKGHTEILSEGKKAFADRGEYDAKTGIVKLFDNVKIVDDSGYTATADIGIYDSNKKMFTLHNNVMVRDDSGYTATSDTGIYDSNKKMFTLQHNVMVRDDRGYTAVSQNGIYNLNEKTFTLLDNVRIDRGSNIITAPKAVYFQEKDELRFYGGVKVTQDGSTATALNGVYFIKKNLAELEKNVVITKERNVVRGDKAISDFNTSKSRLISQKGGRISGKLIESTLKSKKDN